MTKNTKFEEAVSTAVDTFSECANSEPRLKSQANTLFSINYFCSVAKQMASQYTGEDFNKRIFALSRKQFGHHGDIWRLARETIYNPLKLNVPVTDCENTEKAQKRHYENGSPTFPCVVVDRLPDELVAESKLSHP